MILLLALLAAGCASVPSYDLDTSTCDPAKQKCYAITERLLDKFLLMDDDNYDLKGALKYCQRHEL